MRLECCHDGYMCLMDLNTLEKQPQIESLVGAGGLLLTDWLRGHCFCGLYELRGLARIQIQVVFVANF